VSALSGILGFIGELALYGAVEGAERRRDRRLLGEGRARCGIRSVSGRVLDIGSEWSVGTCVISTGRIDFRPEWGIVGDRAIEVLEIGDDAGSRDTAEVVDPGLGPTVTYLIRTQKGDLRWALPTHIAERASGLLLAR
jgi:hypothetical protein